MASGLARNVSRSYLARSFSTYAQYLWRPKKQLMFADQQSHNVFNYTETGCKPYFSLVISLDYATHASTLSCRYLASSAAPEDPSNKPQGVASKEAERTGQADETGPSGKPIRRGPVTWLSLFLLISTGAGLIYYYDKEKKRHIEEINTASTAVKQGPSAGKAAIGGPFKLVNHEGKLVTEKDFCGKWTLIYFGFTHCPDICPDELQKLAAAVDKIRKSSGIEIVPVFISVDPERDTVEQVGEYVKEFHPNLIGLTGNADEIRQVARAYRVYYMKTEEEGSDYLVDHSIVMYLMDPNMDFVKFFGKNYDADTLAEGIVKEIKQYKK
ncbi:hypothetical protein AAC387_Pa01g0593 [Persea americana]